MTKIEFKAQHIYYMGYGIVSEEEATAIVNELNKYRGDVYVDIFYDGIVAIEVVKWKNRYDFFSR